jgi:hypothetical protein
MGLKLDASPAVLLPAAAAGTAAVPLPLHDAVGLLPLLLVPPVVLLLPLRHFDSGLPCLLLLCCCCSLHLQIQVRTSRTTNAVQTQTALCGRLYPEPAEMALYTR